MTETAHVLVNGRWELILPKHRADRPEWPWWEATRLAAMRTVIGHETVVWDVGAEEGDFPALWASWGARVVMAEPNPKVWPNIKLVWEANELPDPLLAWPGFIGEADDRTALGRQLWPAGGPWPACADGPVIGDHGFCQLGERPDLPTTSIDFLVSDGVEHPDVITMDVEGSEWHVLAGAVETIREYGPEVFVSIHPEFMQHHYGISDGVERIRGFFDAMAYDERFLCIDHEHHWWFRPRRVTW